MAIKKDNIKEKLIKGGSPLTEKMIGHKYGRLTVLKYLGKRVYNKGFKAPLVLAKCECGSVHRYIATKLRTGYTKSCGCLQAEKTSKRATKHGQKSPKYGKRGTIMYARWRSMFDRVRSDFKYKNVKISDRWQGENGFINFCTDMGKMPTPKHTVDRYPIYNGNYEPGNTRWATQREQMQNCSINVNYEYKGELLCISEIARRTGQDPRNLNRLIRKQNMTVEEAINHIPYSKRKRISNENTK